MCPMHRMLNLAILVSFFVCYVDFGHDGKEFIGQTELYLLTSVGEADATTLLAFILPIGQIILIFASIKPKPDKALTIWGMVLLGIVVLLVFGLGLLTGNMAVVSSTIPFLLAALICISYIRRGSFDKTQYENEDYHID